MCWTPGSSVRSDVLSGQAESSRVSSEMPFVGPGSREKKIAIGSVETNKVHEEESLRGDLRSSTSSNAHCAHEIERNVVCHSELHLVLIQGWSRWFTEFEAGIVFWLARRKGQRERGKSIQRLRKNSEGPRSRAQAGAKERTLEICSQLTCSAMLLSGASAAGRRVTAPVAMLAKFPFPSFTKQGMRTGLKAATLSDTNKNGGLRRYRRGLLPQFSRRPRRRRCRPSRARPRQRCFRRELRRCPRPEGRTRFRGRRRGRSKG